MKTGKPDILFVSAPQVRITLFSLLRSPNLPKPDCTFAERLERRKTSVMAARKCAEEHGAPDLHTPNKGTDKIIKYIYEKQRRYR